MLTANFAMVPKFEESAKKSARGEVGKMRDAGKLRSEFSLTKVTNHREVGALDLLSAGRIDDFSGIIDCGFFTK